MLESHVFFHALRDNKNAFPLKTVRKIIPKMQERVNWMLLKLTKKDAK
jgi:hypothetical protein